MHRPLFLAAVAFLTVCCALSAQALEVTTGQVDVSFHISHPAKEYDAFLLPDGGYGVIQLDPAAIEKTTAKFTIKVDHFNSDNTRRDSHMLEVLEGFVYPTIEWSVTAVSGATGPWTPGTHKFTATGPLQVHGVTRTVEIPVEITVGGKGELTFGAAFSIELEDYSIERPTLVFVPIENTLPITVKVSTKPNPGLFAKPAKAPDAVASEPGAAAAPAPAAQKNLAGDPDAPAKPSEANSSEAK